MKIKLTDDATTALDLFGNRKSRAVAISGRAALAGIALASATGAFGQSSVGISGIMDAAVSHGSGSLSSKNQLTPGLSRIRFVGIEDLGGDLKAGFWLESQLNSDNGTGAATNTNNQTSGASATALNGGQGLTFNRRSHVSVGGDWGEVRLGREYTPQFWNQDDYDPFATGGVGANQVTNSAITGVTNVRASNSVSYLYGNGVNLSSAGFGPDGRSGRGFMVHAMYYLGENASGTATSRDGTGYGVRANYSSGTFTVSAATGRTTYAAGNVTQTNIGGDYDFGKIDVMAMYERDKNGAISGKGYLVGATVEAGPGYVRGSYSRYETDAATNPTAKKWALGYVYRLSKRTSLYGTYAHVSNAGSSASALNGSTTAAGGASSGFDVGLKHSF
jgi:predicted porin